MWNFIIVAQFTAIWDKAKSGQCGIFLFIFYPLVARKELLHENYLMLLEMTAKNARVVKKIISFDILITYIDSHSFNTHTSAHTHVVYLWLIAFFPSASQFMVERVKGNKKEYESERGTKWLRKEGWIHQLCKIKGFFVLLFATCCRIALKSYESLQEGEFMMQKIEYLE